MEEYAHRKNIERFERDLAQEQNAGQRARIAALLDDERRHLARVLDEKARAKPNGRDR